MTIIIEIIVRENDLAWDLRSVEPYDALLMIGSSEAILEYVKVFKAVQGAKGNTVVFKEDVEKCEDCGETLKDCCCEEREKENEKDNND